MTLYAFGPFVIEPAEHRLTRDGRQVAVPRKAWQILLLLAEAGGRLVPYETFRERLWPNIVVEDRTLIVHVSTLRKALGGGAAATYIETVTGAGYRLAVPVRVLSPVESRSLAAGESRSIDVRPVAVRTFSTANQGDADTYLGIGMADAVTTAWRRLCLASRYRRPAPWTISLAHGASGWSTCWKARCSAATGSFGSRPG